MKRNIHLTMPRALNPAGLLSTRKKLIPVIGDFVNNDATSSLSRFLLLAVQSLNPTAVAVNAFDTGEIPPGGFYATTVQNIKPELCYGRVVMLQWETDRLPPHVVELLNTAKAVMTISRWCAEVFVRSGVRVPVYPFRLGIDTKAFKPSQVLLPPTFTFLTAGRNRGDARKGFDNVIAAFTLAFGNDQTAYLRIKLGEDDPVPDVFSGRIQYIRERLSQDRLVQLYQTATCYINGSRGEGWGYHIHEAIACGCPVISTYWGGVTEFLVENPPNFYRIGHRLVKAASHFGFGRWAQPDIHEMACAMLTVTKNVRRFLSFGEAASETVSHLTHQTMLSDMTKIVRRYV